MAKKQRWGRRDGEGLQIGDGVTVHVVKKSGTGRRVTLIVSTPQGMRIIPLDKRAPPDDNLKQ